MLTNTLLNTTYISVDILLINAEQGHQNKVLHFFFFTIIGLAVFAHFKNNNEETKIKMSIFLMKFNETQNKITSN